MEFKKLLNEIERLRALIDKEYEKLPYHDGTRKTEQKRDKILDKIYKLSAKIK